MEIRGTITLNDGTESQFTIDEDGVWSQWGATRERLGDTVYVLDAMSEAVHTTLLDYPIARDEDEDDEYEYGDE